MVKILFAALVSVAFGAGNYKGKLTSHKTFNGMEIVSGSKGDIENFKNDLDREIEHIQEAGDDKIENRYNNLKQIIQKQMISEVVESIQPITIDGRPWNKTLGLPPLRGSYKSKTLAHDLKSLGYKKDADDGVKGVLPDDHYCKNRQVGDGEIKCCKGENTECYTTAGCFCDESCYTKYGDCCTDHFETCYADLKLCLVSVDANASQNPNGSTTPEQHSNYIDAQESDQAQEASDNQLASQQAKNIMVRNFKIEPVQAGSANSCCLGVPYNSNEESYDTHELDLQKSCCNGVVTWADQGICPDERDDEFANYSNDMGESMSHWLNN